MLFRDFGTEVVFDSFTHRWQPGQKAFFTTLLTLETLKESPTTWPAIYTTRTLKSQLMLFFRLKEIQVKDEYFHVLEAFQPTQIQLNDGSKYEVLPCESKIDASLMLLFRKDLRITHLYCGNSTDICDIALNNTFISWVKSSDDHIERMYISKDCSKNNCNECGFQNDMDDIESMLSNTLTTKLVIRVPLFGYEVFIDYVAAKYRTHLSGVLRPIYLNWPFSKDNFVNVEEAKIIFSSDHVYSDMDSSEYGVIAEKSTLKWLPSATQFDIALIASLTRPKEVFSYKLSQDISPVILRFKEKDYADILEKQSQQSSAQQSKLPLPRTRTVLEELPVAEDNQPGNRSQMYVDEPVQQQKQLESSTKPVDELHTLGKKSIEQKKELISDSPCCSNRANASRPKQTNRCISVSSTVYRQGKKGIHYLDEDSDS